MPQDVSKITANHDAVMLIKPDGRTRGARRYRDLLSAFSTDLGEPLSATADQLVRRLAGVSVDLEVVDAQRAMGAAIDPVAFVRLVGTQRRLLRDLDGIKTAQVKPDPRDAPPAIIADHGQAADAA